MCAKTEVILHAKCLRDKLRIHSGSDQDKALTEDG